MGASTSKKVIIRRFDREPLSGFVNPQSYLQAGGLEVLSATGVLTIVSYEEVKVVYFVRDFDAEEPQGERRVFSSRPKMSGLWVRMRFRDGEVMDGLVSNNLLQMEPQGFTFVPPSPSSNSQKVFVPRAALSEFHVLGVVGSPLRPRKGRPKGAAEQIGLFD